MGNWGKGETGTTIYVCMYKKTRLKNACKIFAFSLLISSLHTFSFVFQAGGSTTHGTRTFTTDTFSEKGKLSLPWCNNVDKVKSFLNRFLLPLQPTRRWSLNRNDCKYIHLNLNTSSMMRFLQIYIFFQHPFDQHSALVICISQV